MAILDQADLWSVRRAIDSTLDDGIEDDDDRMLPDRVITDPIHADTVDDEVYALIPGANPWPGTLSPMQIVQVKRATVFLTAARVYPTIPNITQEQIGSEHRYRREYESVEDVVLRLRGDAYDILSPLIDLLGISDTPDMVTRFRRAPAYRGRMVGPSGVRG